MIYNYHTHTSRCGHACGTDREYVESAINSGIKVLGFSDHSPMLYDPDPPPRSDHRMRVDEFKGYCDSVRLLKEEYKNDIEIHLGVEIEYYPKYFEQTYRFLKENGVEYMILGQHFTLNQVEPEAQYAGFSTLDDKVLNDYTNTIVEQIASGRYAYIAHPDLINYKGDELKKMESFKKICEAAVKYDVPLEINILGIQDDRAYPKREFWRLAGEMGVNMIIGIDAHSPSSILNAEKNFAKWESYLIDCGLNVSRETFADFDKSFRRNLL